MELRYAVGNATGQPWDKRYVLPPVARTIARVLNSTSVVRMVQASPCDRTAITGVCSRTGASEASRSRRVTTSAAVRYVSRCCSIGFIQPGLFSRSEFHRWVRHVSPARPRSSTTWSTPRATSVALAASPAGPAPTTTQSVNWVLARR